MIFSKNILRHFQIKKTVRVWLTSWHSKSNSEQSVLCLFKGTGFRIGMAMLVRCEVLRLGGLERPIRSSEEEPGGWCQWVIAVPRMVSGYGLSWQRRYTSLDRTWVLTCSNWNFRFSTTLLETFLFTRSSLYKPWLFQLERIVRDPQTVLGDSPSFGSM